MGLYLAHTPRSENNNLTLSRLYKNKSYYITEIIIHHLKQLIGILKPPPQESNQAIKSFSPCSALSSSEPSLHISVPILPKNIFFRYALTCGKVNLMTFNTNTL